MSFREDFDTQEMLRMTVSPIRDYCSCPSAILNITRQDINELTWVMINAPLYACTVCNDWIPLCTHARDDEVFQKKMDEFLKIKEEKYPYKAPSLVLAKDCEGCQKRVKEKNDSEESA